MSDQIIATKNNLMQAQRSLALAKSGYDLLDRKRSILVREILRMSDEAKKLQNEISVRFSEAYFALREAHMAGGYSLHDAETVPEDRSVSVKLRSVMGVELPTVTTDETPLYPYYGFSQTHPSLDEAYEKFVQVKKLIVELARIQTGIVRLSEAIKKTGKRTNALGNLMIPRFEERIRVISAALEEKEREEFVSLKVIKKQ